MNNKSNILPDGIEEDPFLRDAQEGWAQFPGARSRWRKTRWQFNMFLLGQKWRVMPSKGKLAVGTLMSAALITVAAVTIPFAGQRESAPVVAQNQKITIEQEQPKAEEKSIIEPVSAQETRQIFDNEQFNTETLSQEFFDGDHFETGKGSDRKEAETKFYMTNSVSTKTDSIGLVSPMVSSAKYSTNKKRLDDALSYIWVDQYRILDYDALKSDKNKSASVAEDQSLDVRFSTKDEVTDIAPAVSYDTISYNAFVGDAVTKLNYGQYSDAEYQFKKLLVQHPKDENALFYLGLCAYQKGDYTSALGYFERTKKTDYAAFAPDADWYTARIYLMMNERTRAKNLLHKIERQQGLYEMDAHDLLEKEFHE